MRNITIRNHYGLENNRFPNTLELWKAGLLPEQIEGWLLVVPLRHALRCIYGTDTRAALALIRWLLSDLIVHAFWRLRRSIGLMPSGLE